MSKLLQKIVISLLAILLATSFVGCGAKKSDSDTSATLAERMYAEAVRLGFEGTYEEFILQVSGADGKDGTDGKDGQDGKDGIGIVGARVNEKGELMLELSDGNIVNAGIVRGSDGQDGLDGTNGADGLPGQDGANGTDGKDGTTWHVGTGMPSENLVCEGDLYLDTKDFVLYRKTGAWERVASFADYLPKPGTVKIAYNANGGAFTGGSENFSEELVAGGCASLPKPERTGYLFVGWYTDEGIDGVRLTSHIPIFRDTAVYAKWMPKARVEYGQNRVQITENEIVPECTSTISDLYQVTFAEYEVTRNGVRTENSGFMYSLQQESLGVWNLRVFADGTPGVGVYGITVTVHTAYTDLTLSFEYIVTEAPVHNFTEISMGGESVENQNVQVALFDSCDILFRLESSFSETTETVSINGDVYSVTEEEMLTQNTEEYILVAECEATGDSKKISVTVSFLKEGIYTVALSSVASVSTVAATITFTVR